MGYLAFGKCFDNMILESVRSAETCASHEWYTGTVSLIFTNDNKTNVILVKDP